MGVLQPDARHVGSHGQISLNSPVALRCARGVDDINVAALRALMLAYLEQVASDMAKLSGLHIDPADSTDETFANLNAYQQPDGAIIVAERGEDIVGCALFRRIRSDAAEVKRLYVRPDQRGQGLGHQLVDFLTERARQMGFQKLYLDTALFMSEASTLYAVHGFEFVERYPENSNPLEYAPFLRFMHLRLSVQTR